jgi:hypothetical protein
MQTKKIIAALVGAGIIGAASTTFASANPFVDIPSNHWAYDAVAQLADDGVVVGYGDDTFRGDRNITRYEMAQIIARAMTKKDLTIKDKALLDRLEAEFADELASLGVRISNLERNADFVKWNGQLRYTYTSVRPEDESKINDNKLLFRLEPSAEVNSNWHVKARLDSTLNIADDEKDSEVRLKRAYAEGNFKTWNIKLGKMGLNSAESYQAPGALVFDKEFSGAEIFWPDTLSLKLQAGRLTLEDAYKGVHTGLSNNDVANYYGAEFQYQKKKLNAGVAYYRLNSSDLTPVTDKTNENIWAGNLGYRFNKNVALNGAYANNPDATSYKKSYQASFEYKGVNPADNGSWGAYASYRYLGNASPYATSDGALIGSKGLEFGAAYAPFKNVIFSAKYFNGRELEKSDKDGVQKIFGRVQFLF